MTGVFGIFEYFGCFTHWKWLVVAAHNNFPPFQKIFKELSGSKGRNHPAKGWKKSLIGFLRGLKTQINFQSQSVTSKITLNSYSHSNTSLSLKTLTCTPKSFLKVTALCLYCGFEILWFLACKTQGVLMTRNCDSCCRNQPLAPAQPH